MYASAQRRKLKYFEGFVTKASVVIPPHHELRKRTARRTEEMGFPVPDDAINAMKGEYRASRTSTSLLRKEKKLWGDRKISCLSGSVTQCRCAFTSAVNTYPVTMVTLFIQKQ